MNMKYVDVFELLCVNTGTDSVVSKNTLYYLPIFVTAYVRT